ncbi:unnamed protein product [Menidia menidia]|uniref:(Atlantic silverside) hypothetical protein n=1 Tax=Menidia menidia TaxID=238744 RepID=A0A8S4BRU1_9TELE|nr:unnamed protein product [Menidia menidia]CAG6019906.1 unnamed protein product [Menidia menidia]
METHRMERILFCFLLPAGFWMRLVAAAEVQQVQLGAAASLTCNISYLFDTTWLRHRAGRTPEVVASGGLREGRPLQGFQLSSRYSVGLANRSLALRIQPVEEGDLGLFYCLAMVTSRLEVGAGTLLQAEPPGLQTPGFRHAYCVVVGSGLLVMTLAVCITHWKTRQRQRGTPSRNLRP